MSSISAGMSDAGAAKTLVGNIDTSISIAKSIDRMREVNFLFILVSSFLNLCMKRAPPFLVRLQFLDGS